MNPPRIRSSKAQSYKRLAMVLSIVVFIVSALASVYQTRQIIQLLEAPRSTTTWSVVQLHQEHLKFISSLRLYQHGGLSLRKLKFRYDILWSRFPVLLEGPENRKFRENAQAASLVRDFFYEVRQLEPVLANLEPADGRLPNVIEMLEGYSSEMNRLVNGAFHNQDSINNKSDQQILRLQLVLTIAIASLLLSGLALIVMIIKENRQNHNLAKRDVLTALPNRVALQEYLESFTDKQDDYALMVLDLNGFKAINDSYGHDFGDRVLNVVAQRLKAQMRQNDMVARLGGDEFAVVQTQVRSPEDCSGLAQRIVHSLERPMSLEGRVCYVGTSIGIRLAEGLQGNWQRLLGQADAAMYQAKQRRQGSEWQFYRGEMQAAQEREQQLLAELREALSDGELSMQYQPIVDLSQDKIVGAEARVVWEHPSHGLVEQTELKELAVSCGCIEQLDAWTLLQASLQLKRWHHSFDSELVMAISVASATWQGEAVVMFNKMLIESRVLPSRLIITVTENPQHQLMSSLSTIQELRRIGINISLDNFGSADCPLELLNHLPVQYLRGSLAMVSELLPTPNRQPMLTATVLFANRLGVKLMVRGVDSEEQLSKLKEITKEVFVLGKAYADFQSANDFSMYLGGLFAKSS